MIKNFKYVKSCLLFSMPVETNVVEEKRMCKEQVSNSDPRTPKSPYLTVRTGRGEDAQAKGHPGKLDVWVCVGTLEIVETTGHSEAAVCHP